MIFRSPTRPSVVVAVVVLALCPALAQDGAKQEGAKPAEPAKPAAATAAPAKRERKTSAEAEAALKRFAALLHFPTSRYRTVELRSHCDVPQFGGEVGCKFTTDPTGKVAVEVQLPEAVRRNMAPEQVEMASSMISGRVAQFFKPVLVPADVTAVQYDLVARKEKDDTVVEMTRFDEKAPWDKVKLAFDKDGLLRRQVGTLNVDPNDMMAAMDAGVEIELSFVYRKRGELHTLEGGTIVRPMGESTLKIAYYEIEGQAPLPRELELVDPMLGGMPLTIFLHDFVLDGKPVAGTARKASEKLIAEKKPAAAPPAPKPADPPK